MWNSAICKAFVITALEPVWSRDTNSTGVWRFWGFGAPEVNILQHESHIMELESHLQKAEWGLEGRAMGTIAFFPVFLFLLLLLIICYHGP